MKNKTKNTEEEQKNIKYIDMSINQLNKEITEEQKFLKICGVSDYTLKDIQKVKEEIQKQKEYILEKKKEYLENIKINKEYIQKAKKELKYKEEIKKSDENFKKRQQDKIRILQDIKNNLIKNPNYYKEK